MLAYSRWEEYERSRKVPSTRGQHLLGKEIGDCLLEKLIGYGGSSAVFLAQPRHSDSKVAVKVFLPRSTMDVPTQKSFYRRFLREAQAASELQHPHILSIYSYGEHQGMPYIIMPYMPGGTLSEYVKAHGPLTLREASAYLEQIADALDYAHEQGCVHCDVKPANILLDSEGKGLLSDFGIVRLMESAALGMRHSLQSSDTLMGTPDYISPEQAMGDELDGRSDVYSLAVSLFFLLTGCPPFNGGTPIAMALMHVHEPPPLLSWSRADVTPQIDAILNKALSKSLEDRYQSPGEFSRAFSEAVDVASLTKDIDSVALTPEAQRTLIASRQERENEAEALQPLVQIKSMRSRSALLRSRQALVMLVLGIVLFSSIITAFALISSLSTRQNQQPRPTPTSQVANPDFLVRYEDQWLISSTYFFANGHYHIRNTSHDAIAMSLLQNHNYSDCKLTVTSKEVVASQGLTDFYGVVLRASQDESRFYLFDVTSSDNGQFIFYRYNHNISTSLENGPVPSLHTGIGQSNIITVEARGNTFTFFVNGKQVGKPYTDTSSSSAYASGEIGLSVEDYNAEVAFSNLQVSPF
jgi:serine/threonine protein kinase